MKVFLIIWFGQLVSLIGSGLSGFALMVWVYSNTESVTQYALLMFCFSLPPILFSPWAGVIVDRWNRRWVMILGDGIAGISTLTLMILASTQQLKPWHVYLALFIISAGNTFQLPAFLAAISQLVPKHKLNLANSLRQIAEANTNLLSPILAGVLMGTLFLQGILLIDVLTFLVAFVTLLITRFPNLPTEATTTSLRTSYKIMVLEGFSYLKKHLGLMIIISFRVGISFLVSMVTVLFTPLVLSISSSEVLGFLLSLGGIGMLMGGGSLNFFRPNRGHIHLVLTFTFSAGFSLLLVGLKTSIPLYAFAVFLFMFSMVIVDAGVTIILQKKVEPSFQGRIFALNTATRAGATALAYILSSVLADRVFEPMMQINGLLASTIIGQVIGVGTGKGISLMFILGGLLTMIMVAASYNISSLRRVEIDIPDWSE